ncbi:MAG: hypothetical protein HOP25_06315 [Methylotenera sp.]|nr:hypothetical protein [Methylotenera sp.]
MVFSSDGFINNYSIVRVENIEQRRAIELVNEDWLLNNIAQIFSAESIKSSLPKLQCNYPKLHRIEFDFLIYGSLDIVSKQLAQFLEKKINAEFIPIEGYYQGKRYTEKQFYIMHLFDRYEAIDLSKSVYHEYPPEAGGGINTVEKIVLDETKINQSSAFILQELALTCFRNDICEDISANGFKGLRFIPINEYQNVRTM